ncbi:MAG: isoleucine--tRNA ligase, partial [Alphaproteobacteria bacterium]|nr:isoleucine--tRNA ligase [Alphaproteobacteria bacterium]
MSVDYKDTVFLPKTEFPMKAGLPKREPEILQRWAEIDLWGRLRAASAGREKFILHDGPPYANGHLHIGHALNKILKDVISRSQQMLGKDANYVPGWDCHGLPIEWKIEEEYRADGRDKDQVPIVEFRKECRDFAEKWIDIQRDEFKRLGVIGDWDKPYSTMAYAAEAQIAREIGKFLMNGGLFRGSKPVLWSVVEKTALAEAEVEYLDHKSPTVHARFPIVSGGGELEGAAIVIWTTTPWTLPGNRAIAFDPESEYGLYEVGEVAEGSFARRGEKLVVATELAGQVKAAAGIEAWERVGGKVSLDGVVCAHPLRGFAEAEGGYDFDVPAFAADFVTMDQGTGLVHIGPGAGADDYIFAVEHGLEIPHTVAEDGSFYDHVALFAGTVVYDTEGKSGDANGAIIKVLIEAGALLAKGSLRHDYPHSWRSKAPLIFRNTAQWFISMSTNDLRQTALAAIDNTKFYPPQGRDRLYAMIAERPDWCVSRQRAWGVPIPVFVEKESGEPLRDQTVIDRITAAFEEEGADAWFASEPSRFLGNERDPADYEQVTDVVDVWFDSGSTHSFVLEHRDDLEWPASLYLEGSDQHRGWFHSSLLEACGTRGRAPYDGVLTHGFVMAEDGRKMSKSLGNIVSPQEVTEHQGAEILRLWVVASDYSEDLRIGPEILKRQVDAYRRLRNTLRYLLGNLHRFDPKQRVRAADMPELERWVLHRLWEIDAKVRTCCADFDFHAMFRELYNFCTSDLSAFYFDIRKDCLYCDSAESPRRRAAETVLDETYSCLTA